MTHALTEVPDTDYQIYFDTHPPEIQFGDDPEEYRLLMLFPDDPMAMREGTLFDQQQWLYGDKEWLFYEDRSGEMVRVANIPENQPAAWRIDSLTKELSQVDQVIAHRINVSQRRLMDMADRGIPDPERYSTEEDRLDSLMNLKSRVAETHFKLIQNQRLLRPVTLDGDVRAFMESLQSKRQDRDKQIEEESELSV